MRAMPFCRRFDQGTGVNEYFVSEVDNIGEMRRCTEGYSPDCRPVEMRINRCRTQKSAPNENSIESFIRAADTNMPRDTERQRANFAALRESYADIIRGKRHDWFVSAFRVSVGTITLYFVNPETTKYGFLWVTGAQYLDMTFQTPRTVLGFIPTYSIQINHSHFGKHEYTKITEDLGYIRYEGELKLIDQHRKDSPFHAGNQIFVGTEYAGF